ncbi:hypothetical protein [Flavobacteriaceae bacterium 14752]|uniref:hypothetical protein n=1 Tax=Mesohalobacter salilacus TaxID=2491711 RepID=UPI000F630EC6|nr:hypothetical protein EIG84_12035 [Flavobacteriaceae bacterium 14752]
MINDLAVVSLKLNLCFCANNTENGQVTAEAQAFFDDLANILINTNSSQPIHTETDYPGKDDGLPFEWWEDQDYMENNFTINGITPNSYELLLFAILPPPIKLMHIENSNTALDRAVDLVNNGTLTGIADGKADAFRHAFWNA